MARGESTHSENFTQLQFHPDHDVLTVRALTDMASRVEVERYLRHMRHDGVLQEYVSDSTMVRAEISTKGLTGERGDTWTSERDASEVIRLVDRVADAHRDRTVDVTLGWYARNNGSTPSVLVYPHLQWWLEKRPDNYHEALRQAYAVLNPESGKHLRFASRAAAFLMRGVRHDDAEHAGAAGSVEVIGGTDQEEGFRLVRAPEDALKAGDRRNQTQADVAWRTLRLKHGDAAVCEPVDVRNKTISVGRHHHGLYRMETRARTDAERVVITAALGVLAGAAAQSGTANQAATELLGGVHWGLARHS